MMPFTSKDRKKGFDRLFKERILPFFLDQGFGRHTKTSKRLVKEFDHDLSVVIFFEYKNFGTGFYDINIVYFDAEIGNVYNDQYLAIARIKTPTIRDGDEAELYASTSQWLFIFESEVMPFIDQHTDHKSILNSDQFYISPAREKDCRAVLSKKA
ncbi:MAG: hypothetical protein AAF206_15040 [Bacteroidota bacterium]